MPDLLLYTLVVPSASQGDLDNRQHQQMAQAGILDEDVGEVEQLSTDPADLTLNGVYKGQYAGKMAAELDELSSSSGFSSFPLSGLEESTSKDGYYSIEDADIGPNQAQTDRAQQYRLSLKKKGRRASHYRAIESNPRSVDHEFGNSTSRLISVPASARKTRWFDPDTREVEVAEPTETRSAELGDVEVYDFDDASVEAETPTLIYSIEYTEEENVDCRVYDSLEDQPKHDEDGNLQWYKVFATDHDPSRDGEIVLDNGLIRLCLDEDKGTLEAEEWDDDEEEWTSVDLSQPTDIDVYDLDVSEIGMVRDKVQVTFDVDGDLFVLDAILETGAESILFDNPDAKGQGPIPASLEEMLSPVASERYIDTQSSKTLTRRRDVRLSPSND